MSILSDIREGLKSVIEAAIPALVVFAYEPDGIPIMDQPYVIVEPTEEIPYNRTISSNDFRTSFLATLYLLRYSSEEGWKEMDEFRSPTGSKSLRAAVKTDDTLDGSVTYAEVIQSGQVQRGRDDGDRFWEFSCQFQIDVIKNLA